MHRPAMFILSAAALCVAMAPAGPARSGTLGQSGQVFVTSTRTVGPDGGAFCTGAEDFRLILKALYDGKDPDPVPRTCRKVEPGAQFTTRWLSWIDESKGLLTSEGTLGKDKGFFVGQLRK